MSPMSRCLGRARRWWGEVGCSCWSPWGNVRGWWDREDPTFTRLLPREALGVVLHKDSKWYQQWKDFKDNNVVFTREWLECGADVGPPCHP